MTDRNKFEQMLEHLINDDSDKAKELFHQIVVAKSREIYEQILAEDFEDLDEKKEEDDEDKEVDESAEEDDEDKDMDESFGFAEGEDDETGDDVGGDAGDDMIDDLEADDEEGMDDTDDIGGEGDLEDRVMDLEDALDELKSEFEAMMGGEEGMDDIGGDEFSAGDDGTGMDDLGMDDEEDKLSFETDNFMREYVEKVGGKDYTSYGKMGDNGVNTKSIVAGKNDMGGTTANLKGGTESGPVEANKGHLKGSSVFKGNPKEDNMGNINVPGGNAGKTAFKHKEPTYPNGLGKEQADKGAGSLMNGAPKRAK